MAGTSGGHRSGCLCDGCDQVQCQIRFLRALHSHSSSAPLHNRPCCENFLPYVQPNCPCCGSDCSSHPFAGESGALMACWGGRQQLEPLLPSPGWTKPPFLPPSQHGRDPFHVPAAFCCSPPAFWSFVLVGLKIQLCSSGL